MADPEQLQRLRQGVAEWNTWRTEHPDDEVDLRNADLNRAILVGANLSGANLTGADLQEANLQTANLTGAGLSGARLRAANLTRAELPEAYLAGANFWGANLSESDLRGASLHRATLSEANLSVADLEGADLSRASLRGANLRGANLTRAILVNANLEKADLSGCHVYGVSAWDVRLEGAIQTALVITHKSDHRVTVDELEVAQFIYLLLNNEKIRRVIDTVTSKVVLILGRFTPERKPVLDALRNTLRGKNYSPVVFDFEKPASRNLTETIRTLAHLSRFVIADITDAKSIPQELMAIVPDLPSLPVQPLLLASEQEYGMFEHFRSYPWVLEEVLYDSPAQLAADVEAVIAPAEQWLEERRRKA